MITPRESHPRDATNAMIIGVRFCRGDFQIKHRVWPPSITPILVFLQSGICTLK